MNVRVGTSGYAYKEWKGSFYPEKLKDAGMLHYYATQFPTVEINNTFYRMPTEKLLEQWREQVPDTFRFVLKASRQITHIKRLKDVEDPVRYLLRTAATLGPQLGAVLFQLPPYLKRDVPRLTDFLALLPAGTRAAVEFRDASWFSDDVYAALRARAIALCVAQTDEIVTPLVATAPLGYLRLRREAYPDEELENWAAQIRAQPWTEVYVFFKHEEEGVGPKLAKRFESVIAA